MKIPLFDIDWTLLAKDKVRNIHRESLFHAWSRIYGLSKPATESWEGKIDNQILTEIAMLNGISKNEALEKLPLAIEAMKEYFFKHKNEGALNVLPGVIELLEELQQRGSPVGLLTGNVETLGWEKLKKADIKHFFQFGSFGDLAMKRADLIKIAHRRAEELLHRTFPTTDLVIIGDTPLDIACAIEGGIGSIGVATGPYSKEELKKAGANLAVDSLLEKERILNFLK